MQRNLVDCGVPAVMEYDLQRLFEHPVRFHHHAGAALVVFGGQLSGEYSVRVRWRTSAGAEEHEDDLRLRWDKSLLEAEIPSLEKEIANIRDRDEDRGWRTELTAIVVAVAVMAHVEPTTRFTVRANKGTFHDYYLNETHDEMIEIAGRWEGGLPSLFEEKRQQSDNNRLLRKRVVSYLACRPHSCFLG